MALAESPVDSIGALIAGMAAPFGGCSAAGRTNPRAVEHRLGRPRPGVSARGGLEWFLDYDMVIEPCQVNSRTF